MEYDSASEGEIVETKATTTNKSGRDRRINGNDRPRSLKSGSTRLHYSDNDSDGLDYDDHSASSKAGSPNRRRYEQAPTGVKRRYPEDERDREYSDPRRFKVYYEEDQSREGGYGSRGGQQTSDNHDRYGQRGHYDRHHASSARHRDDHAYISRSVPSKERSTLDPPLSPAAKHKSAEHDHSSRANSSRRTDEERHTDGDGTKHNAAALPENIEIAAVIDEVALIEERRKRREALRAKHSRETPLVQKVLQANASSNTQASNAPTGTTSGPAEPIISGPSNPASPNPASPTPTSPSTPQPNSPGSPFEIAVFDDAELANDATKHNVGNGTDQGPSAADYDPSMDMQEDRVRESNGIRAAQESPRIGVDKPVQVDTQDADEDGFDMFADDVQIESPETAAKPEDDGIQAVGGLKGKQLDQSMLDDWDDSEGYYRIILGELLDKRYSVMSNLGKGVFSAVVRATDNRTGNTVAIKVIRKQESMYRAGLKEIHTLEKLGEADPEDKRHVIRLERHFMHKGHLCMVFENLSINLREVLKKFGRDVGINIKAVRAYAQQIFLGLSLMKKCDIIHADLKPDNVLVNENRAQLKIADLGSAFDAKDSEVTDTLVSRFYRAPEIMLGLKGDFALDMWSIGCTLFELYTGRILFTGATNNQMLKAIMECRGKIPNRVLKKAEFWDQHFQPDGTFLSQQYDSVTRKDIIRPTSIVRTDPSKEIRSRVFASAKNLTIVETKELNLFADLLEKCLAIDPARRISPNDALRHGFINRSAAVTAPPAKIR
ncbi:Protein kinase domain-containing protein 39 [Elsinoe fawcettii]|nr:Protein kinase domain-containing protein 39 [Elsinoe fawcettii]